MSDSNTHQVKHVIEVFNQCFADSMNTRLVLGDGEPLYLPASNRCRYHRVVFAHGFYRSALHEIAHWCVAGKVRRQLLDYGYWYKPDGRNADEQRAFEQVELKPQALEWLFCLAAGHSFEVSCDNLGASDPDAIDSAGFAQKVHQQLRDFLQSQVPPRAAIFAKALANFYGHANPLVSGSAMHNLPCNNNTQPEYA